ncbi:MAG TPA: phosphotransferase [Phycisphaerales bacterium]|nr:phosphotransferase [Phycisphaerales bacterium]
MPDQSSSSPSSAAPGGGGSGSLSAMLEPKLTEACGHRISKIEWFHADWQAGGASTGATTFTQPDGSRVDAIVKLPVGPSEHRWTALLGGGTLADGVRREPVCQCTPRVLACGTEVGGYDLAWLIVERLDGTPHSGNPSEHDVRGLLSAAAEFYRAAAKVRPIGEMEAPPPKDWHGLISKGRDIIHNHGIAEEQRWNTAIRSTQRVLDRLIERWQARPINTWCHGDLHFGNAMRRRGTPEDHPCVLIDLALVHAGHWVEDAVYLERLYWAKPELLRGIKPVSEVARLQRQAGTLGQEDYAMLANIRRVLMAASVPAFLLHEGHPRYVHAALELLERLLPLVGR